MNERNIRGRMALLMDLSSLTALRSLLRDFIRRMVGKSSPAAHVAP